MVFRLKISRDLPATHPSNSGAIGAFLDRVRRTKNARKPAEAAASSHDEASLVPSTEASSTYEGGVLQGSL